MTDIKQSTTTETTSNDVVIKIENAAGACTLQILKDGTIISNDQKVVCQSQLENFDCGLLQ